MICIHFHSARATARRAFKRAPIVAAMLTAGLVLPAYATNFTWFGGNGDWGTAAYWLPAVPSGPPGSTDIATINAGTASLPFAAFVAGFNMGGGQLSGTGTLTVSDAASLNGGSQTGTGTTQFNGSVALLGNGSRYLSGGRVLNIAGTTTWGGNTSAGGNAFDFNGSGTIVNTGTWNDTNAFSTSLGNGGAGFKTFTNSGTYNKLGNAASDIYTGLNNTGTITVSAGRLSFLGSTDGVSTGRFEIAAGATLGFGTGASSSGLSTVSNATFAGTGTVLIDANNGASADVHMTGTSNHAGTLAVTNGFLQVDGTFSVASFSQTGGQVGGTGTLIISGPASFTGGNQTGEGITQFNGSLELSGNGSRSLSGGRTMKTAGVTTWGSNTSTNGNALNFGGSGTIVNSGTWNDTNAFNTSLGNGGAGFKTFTNSGTYNKLGNAASDIYTGINNTGTITVSAGRLSFLGSADGLSTGRFEIAAGATLGFGSGASSSGLSTLSNATFAGTGTVLIDANNGASVDVRMTGTSSHAGTLAVANGLLQVDGTFSVASFSQTGGQIGGTGTLIVNGPASFTGGNQTEEGTTQFNGSLALLGNGSRSLSRGHTINTAGTTTWGGNTSAGGNAIELGGGTIANSGTWNDTNFFNTSLLNGGAGTKAFMNSGTYNKLGNSTTTFMSAVSNTGAVNVQQGTLSVTTAFANQGVINVSAGATFAAGNSSFVNTNAGTVQGNGTVQTALNQALTNNGLLSPGNSIGRLTVDGSLSEGVTGSLKFELGSLASFDQLLVTKNATLAGDIGIWSLGYAPVIGDSFVVMTFAQGAASGQFGSLTLHDFAPGTAFAVLYHDHDVTLTVTAVPEPQVWLLMLAGIGVLGTLVKHQRLG